MEFKCFDAFQLYFVENFPFCGKNFHLNVSRRQCCCTPLSGPESAPEVEEKKQIDTRHLIHCPRFNLRNPYRTFCFERLEKGIPDQQQVASDGEIGRETEVQEEQD